MVGWSSGGLGTHGTVLRSASSSSSKGRVAAVVADDYANRLAIRADVLPLDAFPVAIPGDPHVASLQQMVTVSGDPTAVSLEYKFESTTGSLGIFLDSLLIGEITTSSALSLKGSDGFNSAEFAIPASLLGAENVTLEVRLTGAEGSSVLFVNMASPLSRNPPPPHCSSSLVPASWRAADGEEGREQSRSARRLLLTASNKIGIFLRACAFALLQA